MESMDVDVDVDASNAQDIAVLNRYWTQKKKEYQAIILKQKGEKIQYDLVILALKDELSEEKK
jgi:hypothetical protein